MAGQVSPSPVAKSDRMPPYSEEAERGVLGSALLDAARVVDFAVERGISPESFYVPAHQMLFEILRAMTHDGSPIDLLTVGERLKKLGRLDEVGGTTFLERLVDSTPTSAHAEYYIDIVRQKHLLRMVIDKSRQAIDECYSSEEDADSILNVTEQAFFDIKQLQAQFHHALAGPDQGCDDGYRKHLPDEKGDYRACPPATPTSIRS